MSGTNISYEIASGGGERTYFEEKLHPKELPNLANVIAGEIVNEILENALDIAAHATDTGAQWKQLKDSLSSGNTPRNSALTNTVDSKTLSQEINGLQLDDVCSNIVGDIVDHAGITSPPTISEIIDGLNSISVNQKIQQGKQDVMPLDVEMKKLLSEMLSPPYEIVNYETLPAKGGVGDQPNDEKLQDITVGCAIEPEVSRAVEKKSRVTDLVKNSPQIISEYLMMDELAKQNQEEWEESEEKLIQVIELDYVKPGEEPFHVQKAISPENIALPEDEDDEDELIQMPSDDVMDLVDLSSDAFKEEERQLCLGSEVSGAKQNEHKQDNAVIITSSFDTTTSSGELIENIPSSIHKEIRLTYKDTTASEQKCKKKKWNIGTRLWGFFKKSHKQQGQGSSTSTQRQF